TGACGVWQRHPRDYGAGPSPRPAVRRAPIGTTCSHREIERNAYSSFPPRTRYRIGVNYLAHLFLAGDSAESLIGNLAGDFVTGACGVWQRHPRDYGAGPSPRPAVRRAPIGTTCSHREIERNAYSSFPPRTRYRIGVNYLAHLFLAGDSAESLIGNLAGDFVK